MSAVQAEASRPIILADNLSKVYAAGRIMVAAVREVSFEVKPGEKYYLAPADRVHLW